MTFSTIMVHLDLESSNDACLSIAVGLAEQFNAKLIGIAAFSLQSLYYGDEGVFAQSLIAQLRSDLAKRMAEAEERFRSAAMPRARQIEWRSAMAWPADYISREARAADLIVTGAKRSNLLLDASFGYLDPGDFVMQAGRPVLVVPPEVERLLLKCAIVAWKDAREARRAVNDALPLLRKVEEVVVVEVVEAESGRTAAHGRLDDVVSWLDRHGITASPRVFHFAAEKEPVEKLWQYGADFVVAGAYGHSRLREWAFGGFTDKLLRRSPRCAFLAH